MIASVTGCSWPGGFIGRIDSPFGVLNPAHSNALTQRFPLTMQSSSSRLGGHTFIVTVLPEITGKD